MKSFWITLILWVGLGLGFGNLGALHAQTDPLCSDPTACNYNVAAVDNVSACEYISCAGCKELLACNYDADATIQDNGSCVFVGTKPCAYCDWELTTGVNPADGSGALVLNDDDGDGLCNGAADNCDDPTACNFDDVANGACVFEVACYRDDDGDNIGEYLLGSYCPGSFPDQSTTNAGPDRCADLWACNYNDPSNGDCDTDTDDDGVCTSVDLCEERNVPNFDAAIHGNVPCCEDLDGNGFCDNAELFGCTDPAACNYLSAANIDDGSCLFAGTSTSQSGNATSQYQTNLQDNFCDACIPNDSTVTISTALRDALGLSSTTFVIGGYAANDEDGDGICDDNEQVGCNDPDACNYAENVSGEDYPQAVNAQNNPATDEDGNPVFVTESCFFDEALLMGVRPNGEPCSTYCKYDDVCGDCGGTGVDVDQDGLCDDQDDCVDLLACNYDATPTAACQYLTQCGVCADGVDADNDGAIDDDTSDADGDGICDADGTDNCFDLAACNYDDPENVDCLSFDACGVCGGEGVDVDADGLCDDVDECTDVTKCNYDIALYPGNLGCYEDTDGDGTCDPFEVVGCQEPTACNYNEAATDHSEESCRYATASCEVCSGDRHDGTDRVVLQDTDGDGICDDVDLCSDATACNFDANPTEACKVDADGNGTCDDSEVLGCTNSRACNFNAAATQNNSTCTFPVGCQTCSGASDGSGTVVNNDSDFDGVCDGQDNCSDTEACNYIAAGSSGGGSGPSLNAACEYPEAGFNCAGDCLADADDDGICDGDDVCFDLAACNFADPANVLCLYRNTCGDCVASAPGELGYDPDVHCDCDLHVPDILGNCGGRCEADVDNDGICDNVDPCLIPGQVPDACGVCGGPGAVYECGCFELPDAACSCETNGRVTYPDPGADCDGNCIYGTMVVDGQTICKFFDEAEITTVITPVLRGTTGGVAFAETDPVILEDWLIKFDSLHARMATNLDDGTLTGASERLTIEKRILDKGKLDVLGTSRLSGYTQMDSDVVILGNLVIEQDLTVRGTTFSLGGIETTSMDMSGDLAVGGAAVIDSTLEVLEPVLLHDSLTVLGRMVSGRDRAFSVDLAGNTQINGEVVVLDSIVATSSGTHFAELVAGSTTVSTLEATGGGAFHQNLRVSGDADFERRMVIAGSTTIGGSLDVDNASAFAELETTGVDNNGILATDSTKVTGGAESPEVAVIGQTRTQTLEVASTTAIGGSITMRDATGGLVFGAAPTSDSLHASLSLVGNLRMFQNLAAADAQTPINTFTPAGDVAIPYSATAARFGATGGDGLTQLNGALNVNGQTVFRGPVAVDATGTRAFEVAAAGTVTLNRAIDLAQSLTFETGGLTATGRLTYNGRAVIDDLTVQSTTNIGADITATSGAISGGALTRQGVWTGGGLLAGSVTDSSAVQLSSYAAVIDAGPGGQNRNSGLVIKINHGGSQPNEDNVFVDFRNKGGTSIGTILGHTGDNWDDDGMQKLGRDEYVTMVSLTTGEAARNLAWLANSYRQVASKTGKTLSELIPDSWCCSLLLPIGCIIIPIPGLPLPDWAEIAPSGVEAATAALETSEAQVAYGLSVAKLIENSAYLGTFDAANRDEWDGGGVMYASGNGDYAEYLPMLHERDTLHERQIVGVRNGRLTLETDHVDHLVVVSTAPIVVGNLPPKGERAEPVAFMGQVPVDVLGQVQAGDFILPSGDADGFGIARSPEDLRPEDLGQIVGVAWTSGNDKHFNTVNVAVGLTTSAEALMFDKFDAVLDNMAEEIALLKEWALRDNGLAAAPGAPATEDAWAFAADDVPQDTRVTAAAGGSFGPEFTTTPATTAFAASTAQQPASAGSAAQQPRPAASPKPGRAVHPMLAAADKQEMARIDFNENFGGYLADVLGPIHSLAELEDLAQAYVKDAQRPTPLVQSASDEFVTKMMTLALTGESLKLLVREHILGNASFGMLSSIQPGTRAEQELLQKMEDMIRKDLQSLPSL